MSGLGDRRSAMDAELAHDSNLKFRVAMRRNKIVAKWAAEKLSVSDVEGYVKKIVHADFEEAGDDDVVRALLKDFVDHDVTMTEERIRKQMAEAAEAAIESLMNEK